LRKTEDGDKVKFTITVDIKDLEMPAKRKRKKKKPEVASDTPDADEYAYNDKVWNSDVTPGYYKG